MKILVTGATGFIGRALIENLKGDSSYQLVTAVRSMENDMEKISRCVFIGDIDGKTRWEKALGGIDVVIHAAAKTNSTAGKKVDSINELRAVNTEGTINLAKQAARFAVKRFIFISTIKVGGETTTKGKAFTADDEPSPKTPYAISKMEAERELLKIAKETGMEVVIIRPPLVYGKGAKGNIETIIKLVDSGTPLPFASLKNKRSMVGIDNLIDFIKTCITHKAAGNQKFLVSDGDDLSTAELIKMIAQAKGKKAFLIPCPTFMVKIMLKAIGRGEVAESVCGNLQADISKTRELLDWKPLLTAMDGLYKLQ